MPSVELELSPYKNQKNLQAIKIRIKAGKSMSRKATGISIEEKYWDKGRRRVKKNHPLAFEHNAALSAKILEAERSISIQLKQGAVRPQRVVSDVFTSKLMNDIINSYAAKMEPRRKQQFESLAEKIESFDKGVTAEHITPEWINDFRTYLESEGKHKTPLKHNTIVGLLNKLRTAFRAAKLSLPDPFLETTVGSYKPSGDTPLTIQEIKKLIAYKPRNKSQQIAKDTWLLSFFTSGLRSADVLRLEWSSIQGDRIIVEPGKTVDTTGIKLSIPINKFVREILDRQDRTKSTVLGVIPLDAPYKKIQSVQAYINLNLKAIARAIGIPETIKSKLARTTFAHLSQKATGDVYQTKSAMGHSRVATTEIYLALSGVETDEATNAVERLFES